MNSGLVSVITPVYNSEKYIKDCIDSVLIQDYANFELILIDDGSLDETKNIISKYSDPRIVYFYQENKGPAAARNRGLSVARGEYIAFIDSDDIWLSSYLSKQLTCLKSDENISFCYCGAYFVDERGVILSKYIRNQIFLKGNILKDLFNCYFLMTPGVLIKKECVEFVGIFDESLIVGEDYDYFLRIANHYNVNSTEEKLWKRRVRFDSLSRKDFLLDAENDLFLLKRFAHDNPQFLSENKRLVNKRLASYHYDTGYWAGKKGLRKDSLKHYIKSIYYKFSFKTLLHITFCMLNFKIQNFLTKLYEKSKCNNSDI